MRERFMRWLDATSDEEIVWGAALIAALELVAIGLAGCAPSYPPEEPEIEITEIRVHDAGHDATPEAAPLDARFDPPWPCPPCPPAENSPPHKYK